ncbi:TetR/AcrR family transcriptional regulator [Lonepinella sp. MS14435]|uniref:TetR/AcrR family transcriptional regulator n=1 Tax=Lonepinella sp. MS14435 TaxID=3003618 RepID=UPI0036DC8101
MTTDLRQDLRKERTQKHLRQALISLLNEKPYNKINVQEICDRAMINTSTFYRHFYGKSELAGAMIAEFKAEFEQIQHYARSCERLSEFNAEQTARLFELRHSLLALWKIDTPRHHLYQDMFASIQQQLRLFVAKQNKTCSEFQTILFATTILTVMKYYFERDLPVPAQPLFEEWQGVLDFVV